MAGTKFPLVADGSAVRASEIAADEALDSPIALRATLADDGTPTVYNGGGQMTQRTFLSGVVRDYRYNGDGTIDEVDETVGVELTTYVAAYNGSGQLLGYSIAP